MKIGTLSLNIHTDDLNYGAMLHSWAFQQVLNRISEVEIAEIIDYTTCYLKDFKAAKPVRSYFRMQRYRSMLKIILSRKTYQKRYKKFNQFITKDMNCSPKKYNQNTLNTEKLNYDCLICESDVIWSSKSLGGKYDKTFFLALDSMRDKRKVVYAASMANAELSELDYEQLPQLLQYPDALSCRESYSAEIASKYTKAPVACVLDPVLLLDDTDYEKITSKRLFDFPYLLVYIPLGYNRLYLQRAHEYAAIHGLKVIELSYYIWNKKHHTVIGDASIEDFLSLIKYADLILTNSFHAVCFSIVFRKQFFAVERKTGRKTIDLCEKLDIKHRYMNLNDTIKKNDIIDYNIIEKKLKEEKISSLEWLYCALDIDKEQVKEQFDG